MDLFLPIVLFIVFCVLFSICGWCCKKHREGTVYGFAGNPNVTVTTQPASTIIPPYPVDMSRHPQPQMGPPGYGQGGYQSGPYSTNPTPYPVAPAGGYPSSPYPVSVVAAPYPTPGNQGYPSGNVPPYPVPQMQQPPSYMEAVGHPGPPAEPQRVNDGYTKQAPYNPHY